MPSLSTISSYLLPVGANIAGGLINRRATNSATNRLTAGGTQAIDTVNAGFNSSRKALSDVYNDQKGLLDPLRATGAGALDTLKTGTAPGGDFVKPFDAKTFDLYKDPGFNWRIQQGQRGINQAQNAGGIRFSGATLKAISNYNQEAASQEWSAARQREIDDQTRAYDRTRDTANIGINATNKEVDAGGTYGTNLAKTDQTQAQTIADLQTDLASAQALGDVARANSISQAINGIQNGVQAVDIGKSLAALVPKPVGTSLQKLAAEYGPTAAASLGTTALGAASLAGGVAVPTAAEVGSTVAGMVGAGIPGFAAPAAGAAAVGGGTAATGVTGALGLGGGSGLFGLGAATIPVIGAVVAGAAIGYGLFKKAQTHTKADQWVEVQNPFDQQMDAINRAGQSGQLTPEQTAESKKAAVTDYLAAAMEFSRKGKDQSKVIGQALSTFRKWYGDPSQYGATA